MTEDPGNGANKIDRGPREEFGDLKADMQVMPFRGYETLVIVSCKL